jgi:tetratricopeptide (TPR) repeat protein
MKRRARLLLIAMIGTAAVAAGGAWFWAESGLEEARGLAKHGLWPEARAALARYLWIHPSSPPAHLLCAEALVKEEQGPLEERIAGAIGHLQSVSDEAPEGALARTQEGRLECFLLYHPARAEGLFRRAIELDPEMPESYYLLWQVKNLTGRSHLAEPEFWKVYEASAVGVRGIRLREWYLSQFYPTSANAVLDRLMGIFPAKKTDATMLEARRLIRFRKEEPESPLSYAALARWFQFEGDARVALESLDRDAAAIPGAEQDPFYLATLVGILIELGQFDRADQCFRKWPEPHEGYEYWLAQGQVLQEVRGEYAEAIRAYDRALGQWPGHVDWRTINRKANCLARLRDQPGATRERLRAKTLEGMVDEKVHRRLRETLGHLDDPKQVRQVADFYRKINRPREAGAWADHIARLEARESPKGSSNP